MHIRTGGVGKQTLLMCSVVECNPGYLGSWRIGCMLNCCLPFMVIMIAHLAGRQP